MGLLRDEGQEQFDGLKMIWKIYAILRLEVLWGYSNLVCQSALL
jgi:hypothetical protein